MWIRGSVRLLVAALFAIEVSVIALASAASATPVRPQGSTAVATWRAFPVADSASKDEGSAPIMRTYDIKGVVEAARWYVDSMHLHQTQESLESAKPRMAVRVSHAFAMGRLRQAGLRWKSSGHCVDRRMHVCTSLEAVRYSTISQMIALKRRSGCPIMITGGTEVGHAPGRYSHRNGYKLDIAHNACINRFITKNHSMTGTRRDGSRLYRAENGTVFANESDHWDILFR